MPLLKTLRSKCKAHSVAGKNTRPLRRPQKTITMVPTPWYKTKNSSGPNRIGMMTKNVLKEPFQMGMKVCFMAELSRSCRFPEDSIKKAQMVCDISSTLRPVAARTRAIEKGLNFRKVMAKPHTSSAIMQETTKPTTAALHDWSINPDAMQMISIEQETIIAVSGSN